MLIALILSLFAFGQTGAAPSPRGPVAVADETEHNLGTVADAMPASTAFEISNSGDQLLHLTLFAKTRGLLGNPPASLDIEPGGKTSLRLDVDTRVVFGPAELGVRYATNDPAKPKIELKLKVIVKSYVLVRPGFAQYDYVQQEQPGTVTQSLWSIDGQPFSVTSVDSPLDWLKVAFREARGNEREPVASGKQWRVDITIMPYAPVGTISTTVTIHIDHPLQKEVRIPIGGFVRPIFAVTPVAPDLGKVKVGEPLRQDAIEIQNFASDKINLTGAKVSVKGLKVRIEEAVPGHRYRLHVLIEKDAPIGPFAGGIVVTTSSEKEPYITIPIRGEFIE